MSVAGPHMAVENALRFLTDHLAGDRYFSVGRAGQNLDRCRTQLVLTELMLDKEAESRSCFARAARSSGAAWGGGPDDAGGVGRRFMSIDLPVVGPESLDAIASLCARSIPNAPSALELSRTLFAPDQPAVVRCAPGVGVVAVVRNGEDGYIRLLALDPASPGERPRPRAAASRRRGPAGCLGDHRWGRSRRISCSPGSLSRRRPCAACSSATTTGAKKPTTTSTSTSPTCRPIRAWPSNPVPSSVPPSKNGWVGTGRTGKAR